MCCQKKIIYLFSSFFCIYNVYLQMTSPLFTHSSQQDVITWANKTSMSVSPTKLFKTRVLPKEVFTCTKHLTMTPFVFFGGFHIAHPCSVRRASVVRRLYRSHDTPGLVTQVTDNVTNLRSLCPDCL